MLIVTQHVRPNQSLEPTATRPVNSFHVTKTLHPLAMLGVGSGGSTPSRYAADDALKGKQRTQKTMKTKKTYNLNEYQFAKALKSPIIGLQPAWRPRIGKNKHKIV